MDQPISDLNTLSQKVLAELERVVPRGRFSTALTDRLLVTIPARNAGVGAITVWLDPGEVTVGVGQLHHTHFEVYTQTEVTPTLDEREQRAAESAASYIRDVLDDRVHFQVQFERGRCRGSSSWYPEHSERLGQMSGVDEVREYVWSGPVSGNHRPKGRIAPT
jgi:hypothetical protein